jgi:hypothetical protein
VVEGVADSIVGVLQYDVSRHGDLIYLPGAAVDELQATLLWWTPEGEEPLPLAPFGGFAPYIDLSPNEQHIAANIDDPDTGGRILWLFRADRPGRQRLAEGMQSFFSTWSPDSEVVYFNVHGADGEWSLWRQPVDRSTAPERLLAAPEGGIVYPASVSGDGSGDLLVYAVRTAEGESEIHLLPLEEGGEPEILVATTPHFVGQSSLSPDGRYLAYQSQETGQAEVYVLDRETRSRILISTAGGSWPVWTGDGSKIFYGSGGRIFRVDVVTEPNFSASPPEPVPIEEMSSPWIDVNADGSRILFSRPVEQAPEGPPRLIGVSNWFRELNERVPR